MHALRSLLGTTLLVCLSCAQTPDRDVRPVGDSRVDTGRPVDASSDRGIPTDSAQAADQSVLGDDSAAADAATEAATCQNGFELCDGRCVDTQSDVDHCGGCGNACNNGGGIESCAECRRGVCCTYDCRNVPNCPN